MTAPPRPTEASAGTGPLCPLCACRPARARCHGCQRDVCAEDHWAMLRLCRACVPDLGRWHRMARVEATNWLETP